MVERVSIWSPHNNNNFNNQPPPNPNQPQTFNAVDGQSMFYQGGTGDDTFIAGTGKDNFEGGGGADTFVFTLGEGSSNPSLMLAAANADGILDFDFACSPVEILNFETP